MFENPVFGSLFLIVFVLIWILVCGLISLLSGWRSFAVKYPFDEKQTVKESFDYSSIQFNTFGSYNNCIHLRIHPEGFSLTPLILFAAFHPPILIRWDDITEMREGKEFFWFNVLDIFVNGNRIRLYSRVAAAIKSHYRAHKNKPAV